MELSEIKDEVLKRLELFVDSIGLDGKWYTELELPPIEWGDRRSIYAGRYIAPESKELNREKYREWPDVIEKGIILVNPLYADDSKELYITLIHEILHSRRNVLLHDSVRNGKNENSYSFNLDKFDQNTSDYGDIQVDASQEILKDSIDTSRNTISNYELMDKYKLMDEKEDYYRDGKMKKQNAIDESLVNLMALLSCKLYSSKIKGEKVDVWESLEKIKEVFDEESYGIMSELVLKHHDFELFYWMLDPITYSAGDLHYDFFEKYAKGDADIVRRIYEARERETDTFILSFNENNEKIRAEEDNIR